MRHLQEPGGTAIAQPLSATAARLLIAGVAAVGLVADIVTKSLAVAHLDPARPVPLLGGLLRLQLIRNSGAAFSMGENATGFLSVLAVVAFVVVALWFAPRVRMRAWGVAAGLLLAGIGGNLMDRLTRAPGPFRGHVVDFLQLPHWPIFNVADMCLTSAAVLIMGLSLFGRHSAAGAQLPAPTRTRP